MYNASDSKAIPKCVFKWDVVCYVIIFIIFKGSYVISIHWLSDDFWINKLCISWDY